MNRQINGNGVLELGGIPSTDLVQTYGTPLMVYDEELIRRNCREFQQSFRQTGLRFQVAYASKAFLCTEMANLCAEEGMSLDVVSGGELYTALLAGFPPERIHFHGNNKTEDELLMGLEANIGCFVVDNFFELEILHELARARKQNVNILIRVTPGVEAHTHEYIMTGQDDSKFGFGVSNGQAKQAIFRALNQQHYTLLGIHSHIGSQIFETDGFQHSIQVLGTFAEEIRRETGAILPVLNVGGGFGVRYTKDDNPLSISEYVDAIATSVKECFSRIDYPLPEVWVEPGRSIVAEAGTTLYKVGAIKNIPNIRKYVSVDGGMTDNIRPSLYGAKYDATLANRANDKCTEQVSIAGKCCESGDMLIWDLALPSVDYGDLLAVFSTGAYGYSMANNYNRIPRPAVVFVKNRESKIVIERETYQDLVRNDRMYSFGNESIKVIS